MMYGLEDQVEPSVPLEGSIMGELLDGLETSSPEPMPVTFGGQRTE
jgi:hypothetical protein